MAKNQKYITYSDRLQIEFWLNQGLKSPKIAEKIAKDRTVVWREINRNRGDYFEYHADHAEHFAQRRASRTNVRKLMKSQALHDYVVEKLTKDDWSPEQISGRLKEFPSERPDGLTINHETIYQFIYEEEPWLYHKLPQQRWSRREHNCRKERKPVIPNRTSISERPEVINRRKEIGHFESDSIVGKRHKQGLSVQYERVIQYIKLHRILNFGATETLEAIQATLAALPDDFAKSFTFDNGSENVAHEQIGLPTYFCEPYKPWQKGGVENANKLIRRYVPKGTDLRRITDQKLREIEHKLNNRPRKKLNYRKPQEKLIEYKMLH